MFKATLVLLALFFLVLASSAQQTAEIPKTVEPPIPSEAAKQTNPVKSSSESLARAKKWWGMDCAMCHGKDGDGKGETAKDMKLAMADFTDPATLKGRTDGELFFIIKNGNNDMPPEGTRIKAQRTGTWSITSARWSNGSLRARLKPEFNSGGRSHASFSKLTFPPERSKFRAQPYWRLRLAYVSDADDLPPTTDREQPARSCFGN